MENRVFIDFKTREYYYVETFLILYAIKTSYTQMPPEQREILYGVSRAISQKVSDQFPPSQSLNS